MARAVRSQVKYAVAARARSATAARSLGISSCAGLGAEVVVGPVPEPFTPAEREILGAVAAAVGLAFEVLAVRALRREVAYWRGRAEFAQHELDIVHGAAIEPSAMRVGSDLI